MPPALNDQPEEAGMFRYRIYDADGNELGEAAYAQRIKRSRRDLETAP